MSFLALKDTFQTSKGLFGDSVWSAPPPKSSVCFALRFISSSLFLFILIPVVVESKLSPHSGSVVLRQLNPIHKNRQ